MVDVTGVDRNWLLIGCGQHTYVPWFPLELHVDVAPRAISNALWSPLLNPKKFNLFEEIIVEVIYFFHLS